MIGGEVATFRGRSRAVMLRSLLDVFRTDFARKVCQTVGARLAVMAIGTFASVLIARLLGVSGRGLYAVAVTVSSLGIQFTNLGLHTANTYYVARDRTRLPRLIGNSLVVCAGTGIILGAVGWFLATVYPALLPVEGILLALCVASIPLGLANLLLKNLLLGVHEVAAYNKVELANTVLVAGGVGILFCLGVARVEAVFATVIIAAVLCIVLSLARLASVGGRPVALDLTTLRPMVRYGVRGYAAALVSFLILRIDLLMVQQMLGEKEAGLYSVAVNMAELIYVLPVIVGTLLFPQLVATACAAERWIQTRKASARTLLFASALGMLSVPFARPAVRLLYGPDFLPAVLPFLWLLPAVLVLSVSTILNNYLAAEGMPWVVVSAPAAGAVLNVLLNWQLLSILGVVGASLASAVAYALMLALLGVGVRKMTRRLSSKGPIERAGESRT